MSIRHATMLSSITRAHMRPTTGRFALAARHFQSSSRPRFPAKNDQDKDSIRPVSDEYSKSGGDQNAAKATEDIAFSPNKTSPEEQHDAASAQQGGVSVEIYVPDVPENERKWVGLTDDAEDRMRTTP